MYIYIYMCIYIYIYICIQVIIIIIIVGTYIRNNTHTDDTTKNKDIFKNDFKRLKISQMDFDSEFSGYSDTEYPNNLSEYPDPVNILYSRISEIRVKEERIGRGLDNEAESHAKMLTDQVYMYVYIHINEH
jgi:hypothetical protein